MRCNAIQSAATADLLQQLAIVKPMWECEMPNSDSGALDEAARSEPAYAYPAPKAAAFLNVAPKTLANWRAMGKGPKFCRLGRRIVYRVDDLRRFMDEHLFDPDEREGWVRR